ncbi:hypothetical protein SAMN05880582_101658 [Rhizobium sp. RU20A]|uniref:hypothetical protein n=1 Tax=Rhizobium sp. RU20A TaxID=1907412 RepID=UPI00095609B5|nr:hypothetical protein [Rhizobium sp. RU20A]SIQ08252.1 hypothetical protein SAMN05880582_101658 [Rhizobium sp. RU20A]
MEFPDLVNFKDASFFFYKMSCDLDKHSASFVFSKAPIDGITPKQRAKLKSKIVDYVDVTFELSNLFADLADQQAAKTKGAGK